MGVAEARFCMGNLFTRAALIAIVACLIPVGAQAAQDAVAAIGAQLQAMQETLAEQQRMLQQQAAEIRELRQQLQTVAAPAQVADQPKPAAPQAPKIVMNGARPVISSADGTSSFAPRAVVQMDMADYHEDADAGATDFRRGSVGGAGNRETNAARDFSDSAYFRRARFGFEGALARDFNYRILLELAGAGTEGPTRINDAWIAYTGFAPFTVQLGAFAPSANMEDSTSVEQSLFIERASTADLSRALGAADGRLALAVRGSGTRWMSSVALTSRTVNDAEVFDSQLGVVARAGFLVASSTDFNLHAGVNGTYILEPADQGVGVSPLRLRDRPEIRVDGTRLIDTGSLDADGGYSAGVELGANWKNFYFQAENFWYGIERPDNVALSDPSFGGYYAQASWMMTGQSRRYDVASGSFQAPRSFTPFSLGGGIGAWELGLRYSHTDLDYREGAPGTAAMPDAVRGGEQNIWTLGVNWYLNPSFRLMLNYLHIDVDRLNPAGPTNPLPFGPSPGTPPVGVQIGQGLDVIALRSQFAF
jgi:phosphate-selective porin OprO and OprP